MPKLNIFGLHV